jgi:cysteine desulfuration protein SufE
MSSAEKAEKIVRDFKKFETWEKKYEHLIALGKSLKSLPESEKKDELKVKGCQSQVWIKSELKDGFVYFQGDSDALIVKGLVALVLSIYSGEEPQDIIKFEPTFLKEIGLDTGLSPSRSNGLFSMIKQVKYYALAYEIMLSQQKK